MKRRDLAVLMASRNCSETLTIPQRLDDTTIPSTISASATGDRFFLREFFVFREDDQWATPE
jgi:hypothetical protein